MVDSNIHFHIYTNAFGNINHSSSSGTTTINSVEISTPSHLQIHIFTKSHENTKSIFSIITTLSSVRMRIGLLIDFSNCKEPPLARWRYNSLSISKSEWNRLGCPEWEVGIGGTS
ncbi:hypothetical protein TNCT_341731 [Trichonephila clavata]|uniref:Uncharacterized protein n=1 Tax=Trichonephila clavata TaxID=2740835 RepID=A0A8X6GXL8_TRICU|nr:hypothetical protein TNCT_341731 [Trichonephila clavata]